MQEKARQTLLSLFLLWRHIAQRSARTFVMHTFVLMRFLRGARSAFLSRPAFRRLGGRGLLVHGSLVQQLSDLGFEHQSSLLINMEIVFVGRIRRVDHAQRREHDAPPVLSFSCAEGDGQRLVIARWEVNIVIAFCRYGADAILCARRLAAPGGAQAVLRPRLDLRQVGFDVGAAGRCAYCAAVCRAVCLRSALRQGS